MELKSKMENLQQYQRSFNKNSSKTLKGFVTYLKNKQLANSTINLYQTVIGKYKDKVLNTTNISQIVKEGLTHYEPSYLVLTREILKSYSQFKQIANINWEKITKLIPQVQKKFFATLNETELNQLKAVRFEKKEQIWTRNNLLLDFLFYTGIRVSELVNLKHSDWENNHLKILGKGNKIRYIPLTPWLIEKINPYSKEYLFTSCQGLKISREYIVRLIRKRTLLATIKKKITPHTFRRSFATLLNDKGAKLTTIQKLLGHSQLQTTANYIHNSWEEIYKDYSRLWTEPIREKNILDYAN